MNKNIIIMFLFYLILRTNSYDVKVKVKQGTLIGTTRTTIFDNKLYYAFYGVPYARPPIKKLRFKNPISPKKWTGPFDATIEYHGACAQLHIVHKHGVYGSEDCLYLNIYTPTLIKNENSGLAVIIWIHGYGFTSSFSHIHGGDFFIESNVIFVTLTHRLSAFGFLGISDTDTNMGLKDIIKALKWVKKNIIQFGGDKSKITIMGNGSSATFLSLLLLTKSHRFFSKMILQSGSLFDAATFKKSLEYEKVKLLNNLRKKGIINWKTASTRDILTASYSIYSNKETIDSQRPLIPFLPIIDIKSNNSLLSSNLKEYFKKIKQFDKPMLIGFNSQESISEITPFLQNPRYLKSFEGSFRYKVPFSYGCKLNTSSQAYKAVADLIKLRYFQSGFTLDTVLKYTSDLYKYPVIKFINMLLNVKGNNIYTYKFNYSGRFNVYKATSTAGSTIRVRGASHGDEICYLMKCEPVLEEYLKVSSEINASDKLFIKHIVNLWANFAKFADPTPLAEGINVTWPKTTSKDYNMLLLGKDIKIIDAKSERNMYMFWNKLYDKYYSSNYCSHKFHEEL